LGVAREEALSISQPWDITPVRDNANRRSLIATNQEAKQKQVELGEGQTSSRGFFGRLILLLSPPKCSTNPCLPTYPRSILSTLPSVSFSVPQNAITLLLGSHVCKWGNVCFYKTRILRRRRIGYYFLVHQRALESISTIAQV